jgi:hypothetical protein
MNDFVAKRVILLDFIVDELSIEELPLGENKGV